MLFSSAIFLFWFLPTVLIVYYFLPIRSLKNLWLLVSGLFFYAFGEPLFVFVMIFSILFNYLMGLLVDKFKGNKKKQRKVLWLMIAINLIVFFVFKYLDFTIININSIFNTNFSLIKLSLPIGISFFTFQAMSYVFDVYYSPEFTPAQKNPLNVGLYISLFPQLIAGPIVRYSTIADQIENRKESLKDISEGVVRFAIGLSKKILIANNMALIADEAFGLPISELSTSMAWLGAIAYTFQIYYDFSGYSDMAIGLGKMMGFQFLENFNYPYISTSITEFWRRWHISLSTWFRDYVYIPLGGSRCGKLKSLRNLFVVWLLTGIWHGAGWTFICWGLFYFVLLMLEKNIPALSEKSKNFGIIALKYLYTMLAVIIAWVVFRAENIGASYAYISAMFNFSGTETGVSAIFYIMEYKYFLIAAIIFVFPVMRILEQRSQELKLPFALLYHSVFALGIAVCLAMAVIYMVKGGYNPFIYFNF